MSYVQADALSFSFPGHAPLFENLSFALAKGECLGVTGPSGCGKSTLAQVIAGHLAPTAGSVRIDGAAVDQPSRRVFLVHQDSDLFPWQTVEKQIRFGGAGDPARLIALTKLTGYERFYPHQLSGGMKKRLSLARALAVNPRLLIFDESFHSLDFELRAEIFKDLKAIWRETGTTIILISHDPRDLEQIAQRELRLEKRR